MAVHFLTRWLIFTSPPKGLPCAHYDFHLRWLLQLLWKICNDFCSFLLIISFSNPNLILIPATLVSFILIFSFHIFLHFHSVTMCVWYQCQRSLQSTNLKGSHTGCMVLATLPTLLTILKSAVVGAPYFDKWLQLTILWQ